MELMLGKNGYINIYFEYFNFGRKFQFHEVIILITCSLSSYEKLLSNCRMLQYFQFLLKLTYDMNVCVFIFSMNEMHKQLLKCNNVYV